MKLVVSLNANSAGGCSAGRVVLLGDSTMPAASEEADRSSGEPTADRALALLAEALQIIDALGSCPDIGARLHEIIEALEERRER